MTFPYQHIRRGDAIRYLPLVPITIEGYTEALETLALIDSGAEDNVFRMDVAKRLGIDVTSGHSVVTYGYDGKEAEAYRLPVTFRLDHEIWEAPVIFSEALEGRDLLGQLGFFAFFNVAFTYSERLMEIRRVS